VATPPEHPSAHAIPARGSREPVDAGATPRIAWLAPALLVALAHAQIALAHTLQLSPWKGGGFGMFSTTDHFGFRSVRVIAEEAGVEWPVATPPELDRLRRRARELPTRATLRGLAARAAPAAEGATAIRVEVWRIAFDRDDLRPERRKLAQERIGVAP
jgi:hypothetical protein